MRGGALRGEETQLAEEVHLVKEEVLGLQRVAAGGIDGRPPKLDASSRRRDIAARRVKDAIVGACEGPFGGRGGPVADELLDLEAEVRERFLEHPEKAEDLVTTTRLSTRCHHVSIGGPWVSVAVAVVQGRDVLEDHVSGVGHQLSKCRWSRHPLRIQTVAADEDRQWRRPEAGLLL